MVRVIDDDLNIDDDDNVYEIDDNDNVYEIDDDDNVYDIDDNDDDPQARKYKRGEGGGDGASNHWEESWL